MSAFHVLGLISSVLLLSDWLRRTPLKCCIFVEFDINSHSDGQLDVELSSIIYEGWIDIQVKDIRYGDGAGNTIKENSSVFSLIRMR